MITFDDWINICNLKLGLNYVQFDWTKNLSVDAYDIQCEYQKNGKTYSGRGTELNKEMAIIKSTAEMLERFFLDQINDADTSNGVAVHTDFKIAELTALFELIERDSFFCHFLTKTPFQEIDPPRAFSSSLRASILSFLKSHGLEIRFGELQCDLRFSSVICAIFGLQAKVPFGMSLGTSVKKTLDEAIDSALIESARSAVAYILNPSLLKTQQEKQGKGTFTCPEDHLQVGLDLDYAAEFRKTFFPSESRKFKMPNAKIDLEKISVSSFKPELFDGSLCISPPLYFSRASTNSLINLYFGNFEPDENKLKRLSQFVGREILLSEINTDIHPFA
jgi:hypothetical protein